MLSSGHSEVMSTTAPDCLQLQAKVISTVSPTLLAASKSKSWASQGELASPLGESQLKTSPGAKKDVTREGQGATRATSTLLQALSRVPFALLDSLPRGVVDSW